MYNFYDIESRVKAVATCQGCSCNRVYFSNLQIEINPDYFTSANLTCSPLPT
jgi:hypothetical protein